MSQKEHPLKWYKRGLTFECTGCGKCCTGSPGYVWVSLEEIQVMAEHLELSTDDFCQKYVRKVGHRFSLLEKPGSNFDCIFLKDKKCQIYGVRPKQCKTYPFWPNILESKKSWENESLACEGIHKQAKTVSYEEIEQKRIKQNEELG